MMDQHEDWYESQKKAYAESILNVEEASLDFSNSSNIHSVDYYDDFTDENNNGWQEENNVDMVDAMKKPVEIYGICCAASVFTMETGEAAGEAAFISRRRSTLRETNQS